MKNLEILIIGAGIGGLSAAIALARKGHSVTAIERDPNWSVYGVGIIQQSNVIRAMDQLGLLDNFMDAACGFDAVEIFLPDGTKVARVPSPRLVEGRPANVGIGRRALQKVLGDSAKELGTDLRLGLTAEKIEAVRQSPLPPVFGEDERLVLALTDAMTREIVVPDGVFEPLRARFDPQQLVELVATVAAYNMVSRFLVALRIAH